MAKITLSEDCGNSPKNLLLEKITVALAQGDSEFLLTSISEDISWDIIGDRFVQGIENFIQNAEHSRNDGPVQITIHHVSSHGKAGAVNGTKTLQSGKIIAFCDVYEFSGAKGTRITSVSSYVIRIH